MLETTIKGENLSNSLLDSSKEKGWTVTGLFRPVINARLLFSTLCLLTICTLALFAPWLAPSDPMDMDIALKLSPPSLEGGPAHWLGYDLNGASLLTAMLYGARTSLVVAIATVFVSLSLGVMIGLIAGFRGGWWDMILMRLVDIIMAFPGILLAMALAALMGPSLSNVILAMAATGWTSSARLIRGQTLSIREREYVTAAYSLGARPWRILFLHVFPATLSPLLVHATFSLSGVIIIESSLSFLGLGAQDGFPSWGALLGQGRTVLQEAPFLSLIPGLAMASLVMSLNFLGDALRDILDPKK
jgi:peptide/nickel transport system permease protein